MLAFLLPVLQALFKIIVHSRKALFNFGSFANKPNIRSVYCMIFVCLHFSVKSFKVVIQSASKNHSILIDFFNK